MAKDKFLIAPFNSGLETNSKPWMISDDAFERLNNAYVFRGRVRKRFGSKPSGQSSSVTERLLFSRLATPLNYTSITLGGAGGITNGAGAATGNVNTGGGGTIFRVGQQFKIGAEIFTVVVTGTPGVMHTTGASTTMTYDTTTGDYVFAGATPATQIYFYNATNVGTVPGRIFKAGQIFSTFEELFTVPALGAPVNLLRSDFNPLSPEAATYNTTTGAYSITLPVDVTVPANLTHYYGDYLIYFYPSEPVMGLDLYESGSINNHPAFAFDTQFAYKYSGGRWVHTQFPANVPLHGNNTNFVWSTNWNGLTPDLTYMFSTNFYALNKTGAVSATDDPMYYYTGTTWVAFSPVFLVAGDLVRTAKLIVVFKDHLLLLRTIEVNAAGTTNTEHKGRCRYSHNGSPLSANAFLEPRQVGATGGGWMDAPTEEAIISAEFIKDRLIVYFERSTWELAYTGNYVKPFDWQKLNPELGSESTFSSVPFDKVVLTVGSNGIHACNGSNVQRIDTKIPDQVFELESESTGVIRVAGVRDYKTEMVYWSYPASYKTKHSVYPNTVLVYNYVNDSWALNDDCITAFGYFEQTTDTTWAQKDYTWREASWAWNSNVTAAASRQIAAGNQQGYVMLIDPSRNVNAQAMYISQMAYDSATGVLTLTIIDHTLQIGQFINIEESEGVVIGGYGIYKINSVVDKDNITVLTSIFTGTYLGKGTVSRVSVIDILTKRFNPYLKQGRSLFISDVEFAVQRTTTGEISVDHYVSSSYFSMLNEATINGVAMGSCVLETYPYPSEPFESVQTLLWHRVFFQSQGQFVQLRLYMTDDQVLIPAIAESGFELEGFILNMQPTGEL